MGNLIARTLLSKAPGFCPNAWTKGSDEFMFGPENSAADLTLGPENSVVDHGCHRII
jgi:hypothetical protein